MVITDREIQKDLQDQDQDNQNKSDITDSPQQEYPAEPADDCEEEPADDCEEDPADPVDYPAATTDVRANPGRGRLAGDQPQGQQMR